MFVGIIKTRDIFLHPVGIMRIRGLKGYLKLVWRALSKRPYSFIGMTQESDWIYDKKVQRNITTDPKLRLSHKSKVASASK